MLGDISESRVVAVNLQLLKYERELIQIPKRLDCREEVRIRKRNIFSTQDTVHLH